MNNYREEVKILKIHATIHKIFDVENKVRAIASIVVEESIAIHGFKVIKSAKGNFVGMPSSKYKDEYQEVCHAITAEARDQINDAILKAYERKLEITVQSEISPSQKLQ